MTSCLTDTATRQVIVACLLMWSTGCVALLEPGGDEAINWDKRAESLARVESPERDSIAGVYAVSAGSEQFGNTVVLRWSDDTLCLLATNEVIYAAMIGGIDTSQGFYFAGYYRTVRSGTTGRLRFSGPREGALRFFSGAYGTATTLALSRVRPLHAQQEPFYVIAHRGGGRNSDRLMRSENSLAMVQHAATLGANAVEIDVARTRDNQLIVFHDKTFSPRTVQGTYLLGPVTAFTLSDIRNYGRLKYGEPIPTLEEMLNFIIDSTEILLVWLDVKEASVMDLALREQGRAIRRGRTMSILIGIPTVEVFHAYMSSAVRDKAPVLCELDRSYVVRLGAACKIWAPRWTNGDEVRQRDDGRKVVTWTLDVRDYMEQFLARDLDGILTNYPSLLAGMYYSRP
jgi:glycerophosphoryl diester phosphodiesterase